MSRTDTAQKINALRATGVPQAEIARRLGVTRQHVSIVLHPHEHVSVLARRDQRVIDAIREAGRPLTACELGLAVGCQSDTAAKRCRRMATEGRLDSTVVQRPALRGPGFTEAWDWIAPAEVHEGT